MPINFGSWFTSTPATRTTGSTSSAASPSAAPSASPGGPLAPAFNRDSAPMKAQIKTAMQASEWLGQNFKAALMEVGFGNVRGKPTFYGYGTHKPMTASMDVPPGGRLDLTVCLNVSGHDLKDRADKQDALANRARDNRYVVRVTHPDGRKEEMKGIAANGALSTAQDISIQGVKPGLLVVEAWPEGSAGVGGYIEGRRLEITVRGAVDGFGG